jgi:hypothetical protein
MLLVSLSVWYFSDVDKKETSDRFHSFALLQTKRNKMKRDIFKVLILSLLSPVTAFYSAPIPLRNGEITTLAVKSGIKRRDIFAPIVTLPITFTLSNPVNALIEGNPVPAKKKALSEEYMQGTSALANMDADAPIPKEAYKKLPSGVIYADLRVGSGETINEGSRVNIQW